MLQWHRKKNARKNKVHNHLFSNKIWPASLKSYRNETVWQKAWDLETRMENGLKKGDQKGYGKSYDYSLCHIPLFLMQKSEKDTPETTRSDQIFTDIRHRVNRLSGHFQNCLDARNSFGLFADVSPASVLYY